MAQILLVNSPVKYPVGDRHASLGLPMGLAYIGSALLDGGFSVSAVDLNLGGTDFSRVLESRIRREAPSILGISSRTPDFPQAVRIAQIAKKTNENLKIVLGGPHGTFRPEEVLANEEIDVVVRGEGEQTILGLAQYFLEGRGELDDIRGIAYRQDRKVKLTEPREFIKDLDALPYPARFLFPSAGYRFPWTVATSRGCPANCIFCSVNSLCGRRVRFRNTRRVAQELRSLFDAHYARFINFVDDTFTVDKRRTLSLCNALKELPVNWSCATRVNYVTKELLEEMSKAGCKGINYGIESGSQEVLDSIQKGITIEQVREIVKVTAALGISPLCSFMVPHPTDDERTIVETLDFAEELKQIGADISLNFTAPLPGTPLYDYREKYGIRIETDDWADFDAKHSIVSTKILAADEIEELVNSWLADHKWRS